MEPCASSISLCALALASCGQEPPAETAKPSVPRVADQGPGVTIDADQQQRLGVEIVDVLAAPGHAVASGTAIVLDSAAFAAALDEIAAARTEATSLARKCESPARSRS
jgi:hypothetical protein